MLINQRMRKLFSHTSIVLDIESEYGFPYWKIALDVVHQTALSPLNVGDCVPQLQKQVGIDTSCILVLCHAGTYRLADYPAHSCTAMHHRARPSISAQLLTIAFNMRSCIRRGCSTRHNIWRAVTCDALSGGAVARGIIYGGL